MLELADLMRRTYARITGEQAYERHPIEFVSAAEVYGDGYEDCDRRMPTMEKAAERLGWTPKIARPDVLLETMTYYHERYGALHAASRVDMVV